MSIQEYALGDNLSSKSEWFIMSKNYCTNLKYTHDVAELHNVLKYTVQKGDQGSKYLRSMQILNFLHVYFLDINMKSPCVFFTEFKAKMKYVAVIT